MVSNLTFINQKMITFAIDNECSDDIVNFSFSKIKKQQQQFLGLSAFGLAINIVQLLLQLVAALYAARCIHFKRPSYMKSAIEEHMKRQIESKLKLQGLEAASH